MIASSGASVILSGGAVAKKKIKPSQVLRFISDYGDDYLVHYVYIISKGRRKYNKKTYHEYKVDGFKLKLDDESKAQPLAFNKMPESVLFDWADNEDSAVMDPSSIEIFDAIFDPGSIRDKFA